MELPRPWPLVVVLSGCSGVGKDAVLGRMRELGLPFHFIVTATTRPRRQEEVEGRDYLFLSQEQFDKMRDEGQFLEWAKVYGHCYGVPRKQVQEAFQKGQDVIVKVDVQGAATIKGLLPQGVFIFLAPPSLEELEQRLRQRRTESSADLEIRLRTAQEEMKRLPMFDYVVVNAQGQLDQAVSQIQAIVAAEKLRVSPRKAIL